MAIGVCLVVGGCVAGVWGLSSALRGASRTAPFDHPRIVLTAARLNRIVRRSVAASASTGTARVTELETQSGTPQSRQSAAVTFNGADIDEQITVHPEPAGSAPVFTTDDRLVGGQFYIHTAGPGGVVEWLHDTNSANDVASMQFPDPRTLYGVLAAAGDFETVGTTTTGDTTLTHLRALDPAAIRTDPLGNLASGSLSAFDVWIDSNDVVRRMAFASSSRARSCRWDIVAAKKRRATVREHGKLRLSLRVLHAALRAGGVRETCGLVTNASVVTVRFANLGAPETVAAPEGAVDFSGEG
jgi:hypothetical protein